MKKISGSYKDTALEAALRSGEFIMARLGRTGRISYKGEINIVTDADRQSEEIIVDTIKKEFPRHDILAEERGEVGDSSEYKWIIDPIDGTTNYAHGFPFFCVSLALERAGTPILGVVNDPVRKEVFCAEKGKGAFLNNKKIKVSSVRNLKRALLATGFAYNVNTAKKDNVSHFTKFLKKAQAVRRAGSAALDLCYVACGRFDGFWEINLKPWDSAAGALIVEEAGGMVTRFDSSPFSIYDDEILASNGYIHRAMAKVLIQ